jgi:hypothetical protein
MAVSMWMQQIIATEKARERTRHGRLLQHAVQVRDTGQDVIARIPILLEQVSDLAVQCSVEFCGKMGIDREISLANKANHLLV